MRLPSQEGATAFHPARRWAGGSAYGPVGPRGSTRVALESRGAHDERSSPRWMTVPLEKIIAGDRRAGPSLAAVQANSRAALQPISKQIHSASRLAIRRLTGVEAVGS
jgi:hypothetical protein